SGVAGIALVPGQGLEKVIVPELDVGGHQVGDGRIGAAEHDVLAGPFEVVVDDLEWAGPVPASDSLRVAAGGVEVSEVGVHDGSASAVSGEPAQDVAGRGTVDVAAVEGDVVRQLRHGRGRIAVGIITEQDQVGEGARLASPCGGDLDADETIVMRAE